jgi:hypothetical protein
MELDGGPIWESQQLAAFCKIFQFRVTEITGFFRSELQLVYEHL